MILRWREKTSFPVEIDGLLPDLILGRAVDDVLKLPARAGNQDAELGDLFSAQPSDGSSLILEGDLRPVRGIGRAMEQGSLIVRGRVGPHLGARMKGGSIELIGDADDWAGVPEDAGRPFAHPRRRGTRAWRLVSREPARDARGCHSG